MSIFVIINEWESTVSGGGDVVNGKYFESEGDAWEALRVIAQSYEIDLPFEETSIQFDDPTPNIKYEEYYIQELTRSETS